MSSLKLDDFEKQDIKMVPVTKDQIEHMYALSGTYASLFSKVARKYRILGLYEQELTEEDLKNYILAEYTFLKRPVFIVGEEIFIGNGRKTVAALTERLTTG